jgi:molybdate transport system regulatory protein
MAALLQAIAETGSLRRSAATLGMSYQRAWNLVHQMNRHFVRPLVVLARGGGGGGGAVPTPTGRRVLALYVRMEKSCRTAARGDGAALCGLLR